MSMKLKVLTIPRLTPFGTPFLSQTWERKGVGGMVRANPYHFSNKLLHHPGR